jgi:hypothetical protein|tara:strand:- start:10407 stop:11240 length:834 start_codon:yes stop_codon:yes gene_type:complete
MKKFGLSSVVTTKYLKEFKLLYSSFHAYNTHYDYEWHLVCSPDIEEALKELGGNVKTYPDCLQEGEQWGDAQSQKNFSDVINFKFEAAEYALEACGQVLMLDCDIVFFNRFDEDMIKSMESSVDAIVSPHMQQSPQLDEQWGVYNVGFVYVKSKDYLKAWKDLTFSGEFMYEQKPMTKVIETGSYNVGIFPITYNMGWWRFNNERTQHRFNDFFTFNGELKYLGSNVVSIHTHFLDNPNSPAYPPCTNFNNVMRHFISQTPTLHNVAITVNELSAKN